MADYHILFSTDKHYLVYLFVVIQSILDSIKESEANAQDCLVFHVLIDESLEQQTFVSCAQMFHELNINTKIAFRFEPHKVDSSVFQGFDEMIRIGDRKTLSMYNRLLLAHFFSQDISRVLYLDIDILVCSDIRKVFKQYPMQQEVMYAATTPAAIFRSKNPFAPDPDLELDPRNPALFHETYKIPIKDYICSGVLLINLEQWRAQNIEQKCLEMGAKWILPYHDQDLLSAVCHGKIAYMDWEWDMIYSLLHLGKAEGFQVQDKYVHFANLPLYDGAPDLEGLKKMCREPKIVHFTYIKPWSASTEIVSKYFDKFKEQLPFIRQWFSYSLKIRQLLTYMRTNFNIKGE